MFERKTLLKFLEKAKYNMYCQYSTDRVEIEELLSGYKSEQSKSSFLRDFVKAFSKLQSNHKLLESFDEDGINTQVQTYLRPFLVRKNHFANEQSRKGKSETGKKTGELDITIESIEGTTITFYEGFILNSFNTSVIRKHIQKSLKAYDPTGLKEKYIGVYCRATDFISLTKKYTEYIRKIKIDEIDIITDFHV